MILLSCKKTSALNHMRFRYLVWPRFAQHRSEDKILTNKNKVANEKCQNFSNLQIFDTSPSPLTIKLLPNSR
jgi:hypothetical protein